MQNGIDLPANNCQSARNADISMSYISGLYSKFGCLHRYKLCARFTHVILVLILHSRVVVACCQTFRSLLGTYLIT